MRALFPVVLAAFTVGCVGTFDNPPSVHVAEVEPFVFDGPVTASGTGWSIVVPKGWEPDTTHVAINDLVTQIFAAKSSSQPPVVVALDAMSWAGEDLEFAMLSKGVVAAGVGDSGTPVSTITNLHGRVASLTVVEMLDGTNLSIYGLACKGTGYLYSCRGSTKTMEQQEDTLNSCGMMANNLTLR
jgi:hypothetical protein